MVRQRGGGFFNSFRRTAGEQNSHEKCSNVRHAIASGTFKDLVCALNRIIDKDTVNKYNTKTGKSVPPFNITLNDDVVSALTQLDPEQQKYVRHKVIEKSDLFQTVGSGDGMSLIETRLKPENIIPAATRGETPEQHAAYIADMQNIRTVIAAINAFPSFKSQAGGNRRKSRKNRRSKRHTRRH